MIQQVTNKVDMFVVLTTSFPDLVCLWEQPYQETSNTCTVPAVVDARWICSLNTNDHIKKTDFFFLYLL